LRTVGESLSRFTGAPCWPQAGVVRRFGYLRITVSDSVTDGMSYFYAEVRRLKALLTHCMRHPTRCFSSSMKFHGTTNRERHIGSRAYLHWPAVIKASCRRMT
jgi:hypothetical protein